MSLAGGAMDIEAVKTQARLELDQEAFRKAVDAYKEKLKAKTLWDVLFPWRIIIVRREKL